MFRQTIAALVPHFGYEVENGCITRIGFNSYYTSHAVPSPFYV